MMMYYSLSVTESLKHTGHTGFAFEEDVFVCFEESSGFITVLATGTKWIP